MLFALLGKYNPMMLKTVTNKENEIFTNPPEGIEVVARYSMVGERGGFINIVNTASAESLGTLLSGCAGLIQFEVIPVVDAAGGKVLEILKKGLTDNSII
jgi:hypothetical protein